MQPRQICYFSIPLAKAGLLLVLFAMLGCKNTPRNSAESNLAADAVQFSHQVQAQYAEGFQISYHENYKLLEILKPFQNQTDTLRYSLVPRALTEKVDVKNTKEIPIPVRSLIATSTTHIGLIQMLGAEEVITGIAGPGYVYNKKINKRLEEDRIVSLSQGELNKEKVLAMNPDLLMISGGQSSQFDNYQVLMDSGISVLVNSEWLETNPLGKAEWVKVMAALLNKEQLARERFNAVIKKYNALKAITDTVNEKPLVINNMPYKGAWFVPSGDSYMARFLKDAAADYPWYDSEKTGALRKDFEVVYEVGLKADVWLNPGTAVTREDILAKDSRFKAFKPFENGRIYNNNRRKKKSGGNDFWESGVVHPEIILADLIKIFHPELLPDHQLYYYQKVE